MRRIAAVACLLVLCGCNANKQPYYGKCTIEKVDGKVVSVKVSMPNRHGTDQNASFEMSDRADMDKLITGLESLLLDLKMARDSMPVVEPKAKAEK